MSVLLDLDLNSEVIRQAPGKSKFSQTCNLLSRYLKEKGNSEDLNLRVQSCSSVKNNVTMLPDLNLDLNTSEGEPAHQMTVFYRGKVIVFGKFSEEKVEEIMKLATKSNISSTGSSVSIPNSFQEPQQPQLPTPPSSGVVGSHIPMARRASLHRFLDKRKGRLIAQAPYQLNNSLAIHTKPAETNKTWLRSSSEPATLDLQL